MKLRLTALFDDETRAQVREAVLGEARGIARSVFDKTVTDEVRRLIDLYITHSFGGARQRFQDALVKVVREIVTETFQEGALGILIRETARDAVKAAVVEGFRRQMQDVLVEELRARWGRD